MGSTHTHIPTHMHAPTLTPTHPHARAQVWVSHDMVGKSVVPDTRPPLPIRYLVTQDLVRYSALPDVCDDHIQTMSMR